MLIVISILTAFTVFFRFIIINLIALIICLRLI